MNIKDNAIAFSVTNLEKVVYINVSTYRGKDRNDKKEYSSYTGVIFKKNAADRILSQVTALEEALTNNESVPVQIEGYLLDLDVSVNEEKNTTHPKMEVALTSIQGTKF